MRRGARSGFRPEDGCQVGASHTGDIAGTAISSNEADRSGRIRPYAISLLVVEALAAIVFVPGAVAVCGLVFHNEAHVGISAITLTILVTVLVPLGIGMLLSRFAPEFAEQISDRVGRV